MDVMIAAGGTLLQHREESLSPLHVRNGRKTEVWAKRALWSRPLRKVMPTVPPKLARAKTGSSNG